MQVFSAIPSSFRKIKAPGLLSAWLPIRQAGSILEDFAGKHDGIISSATWGINRLPILNYSGTGAAYVDVGNYDTTNWAGITIIALVDSTAYDSSTYRSVLMQRDDSLGTKVAFALDKSGVSGQGFRFYTYNAGNYIVWASSNSVLSANTWLRVALTYIPGNAPLMWVNGISATLTQVGGSTNPILGVNTAHTYIGDFTGDTTSQWFGGIAEVQLWNRALSYEEVLTDAYDPYYLYKYPSNKTPLLRKTSNFFRRRLQLSSACGFNETDGGFGE